MSSDFVKKCQEAREATVNSDSIYNRIEEVQEQLNELQAQEAVNLNERYVLAFTVDYFISHYKNLFDFGSIAKSSIKHIFLDEAAYCPFIKVAPLFSLQNPVTLFGDHMQLPPICEASPAALAELDNAMFFWDMSALYFPRLIESDYSFEKMREIYSQHLSPNCNTLTTAILSKTYRFGNNLANILDGFVYGTGFSGQTDFDTEITVIHAQITGMETHTRENLGEAQAIREYLLRNPTNNVAVLTPYRNQRQLLVNHLRGLVNYENISTIHAAQGKEWDTVIISVSDTRNMFLTDTRLPKGLYTVNTAISRAKRKIVLVCNSVFWGKLGKEQLIGKLVNNATQIINHY